MQRRPNIRSHSVLLSCAFQAICIDACHVRENALSIFIQYQMNFLTFLKNIWYLGLKFWKYGNCAVFSICIVVRRYCDDSPTSVAYTVVNKLDTECIHPWPGLCAWSSLLLFIFIKELECDLDSFYIFARNEVLLVKLYCVVALEACWLDFCWISSHFYRIYTYWLTLFNQ